MKSLTQLLTLENDRISIIGCGGKTSCMEVLAKENRTKKVLATTSTKILRPKEYDFLLTDETRIQAHIPQKGVQYMGISDEKTGKLHSIQMELLSDIQKAYDLVLIEADGSKGLPLKGWTEFEPIIPSFTTKTIGIVTLKGLGKKAGQNDVHRLPEFLRIIKKNVDSIITLDDIYKMITCGMFQKAVNECILIINQIDQLEGLDYEQAVQLAELVYQGAGHRITKIVIGSIKNRIWMIYEDEK